MIKRKDPYSGDPKIFLTPDGMTLNFNDGVVEKDQGFENFVTFSLPEILIIGLTLTKAPEETA